ncbi:hypothetical protein [Caballeronia sp. BCC1704]|uniref:hypothetical protein n=1 Tax=Caballeronia sp. BCC1704 TaxID=2676300 RepID=UPI00158AE039|nr:hypothetical protein [Caballeronia sp. BCC1704]
MILATSRSEAVRESESPFLFRCARVTKHRFDESAPFVEADSLERRCVMRVQQRRSQTMNQPHVQAKERTDRILRTHAFAALDAEISAEPLAR